MTKGVNLTIFCKKESCRFTQDWADCPSIQFACNYYHDWNKKYHEKMECVHDYEVTIKEKNQ